MLPNIGGDAVMLAYESEIIRFQLHLYARRFIPSLRFDQRALQQVLDANRLTRMHQLFALDAGQLERLARELEIQTGHRGPDPADPSLNRAA